MGSTVSATILLGAELRRDQGATPVASSRPRGLAGDRCGLKCDRTGCPKIVCAAEEVSEGCPERPTGMPGLGVSASRTLEHRVPK
jgi:hypothetical protein